MTESDSENYKPVLLELFSGTGSVGRSFRARGWEVFSVDIDAATNPTLVADVLDLHLHRLPTQVDCIWASPPCTHYSRARTKAKTPRDLEGSDAIVQKVFGHCSQVWCPLLVYGKSRKWVVKRTGGCCRASVSSRRLLQVWQALPQENSDLDEHGVGTRAAVVQTRLPCEQWFQTHRASPASAFIGYRC